MAKAGGDVGKREPLGRPQFLSERRGRANELQARALRARAADRGEARLERDRAQDSLGVSRIERLEEAPRLEVRALNVLLHREALAGRAEDVDAEARARRKRGGVALVEAETAQGQDHAEEEEPEKDSEPRLGE